MNWAIIIIVAIAATVLIVFLVMRNQKDEEELEKEIENDATIQGHEKDHIEIEEINKTTH